MGGFCGFKVLSACQFLPRTVQISCRGSGILAVIAVRHCIDHTVKLACII